MAAQADSESALFGPVELNLITLPSGSASPDVIAALVQQVRAGVVRVLDLVLIQKTEYGAVELQEIDVDAAGLADLKVELVVPGLTSTEDIDALAADLAPGTAAAVVAFELVWARDLAALLEAQGAAVVAAERIPASVVNEIVALETEASETGE